MRCLKKVKCKYSQKVLAETLGVTQPTISGWLNLKYRPVGLARAALMEHFPGVLMDIDEGFEEMET